MTLKFPKQKTENAKDKKIIYIEGEKGTNINITGVEFTTIFNVS